MSKSTSLRVLIISYHLQVICVIEYRLLGHMSAGCDCPTSNGSATFPPSGVRRAHVMNSRRQRAARKVTIAEVPADTIKRLDSITVVDAVVYRAAVLRVLCDIQALEQTTGKAILCRPRLQRLFNYTWHIAGLWKTSGHAK